MSNPIEQIRAALDSAMTNIGHAKSGSIQDADSWMESAEDEMRKALTLLDQLPQWRSMESAPRDGTLIIAHLSTDKGFEDITATLLFMNDAWHWWESYEPVKRQDLIHAWQIYPTPPTEEKI